MLLTLIASPMTDLATVALIIATLSIAIATYWTLRQDIRERRLIRHTEDIRSQVLEPWLGNLPSYEASSPRGPDDGTESLVAALAGVGFKPYPEEVSTTLREHLLEYHQSQDAPHELDVILDKITNKVQTIRSEKRAYVDDVVDSREMELLLAEVGKEWAQVDQQQLAIWLREVFVAEYTGGDFQGEIMWVNPDIAPNRLKVVEKDDEYHYYTLTEKKRDRTQVTNAPIITTNTKVPEQEVENLLHALKTGAEYNFGQGNHNEHIRYAAEAMLELISTNYHELEETLEYYGSLPVLPNDCYVTTPGSSRREQLRNWFSSWRA